MIFYFCLVHCSFHKELNHFHGYILHDDQTKLDDWTLLHKDKMLCVAQQPIYKRKGNPWRKLKLCYLVICNYSLPFIMNLFSHPEHLINVQFCSKTKISIIPFYASLILSPVPISSISNKSRIGVNLQSWTHTHICFLN